MTTRTPRYDLAHQKMQEKALREVLDIIAAYMCAEVLMVMAREQMGGAGLGKEKR